MLFDVDDDANDTISTRKDAQPGRVSVDKSAVSGLKELFLRFNVFKINTFDPLDGYVALEEIAENVENEGERMEVDMHQLTSLATNDVATDDIQHDMLTAQQRGQQMVLENIGKWLVKKDKLKPVGPLMTMPESFFELSLHMLMNMFDEWMLSLTPT